jgi:hypothetical protein
VPDKQQNQHTAGYPNRQADDIYNDVGLVTKYVADGGL